MRVFASWVGILDLRYRRLHFSGIVSLRHRRRFGAALLGNWLQHARWKKSGIRFNFDDFSVMASKLTGLLRTSHLFISENYVFSPFRAATVKFASKQAQYEVPE